jgi:hypothetical protein
VGSKTKARKELRSINIKKEKKIICRNKISAFQSHTRERIESSLNSTRKRVGSDSKL